MAPPRQATPFPARVEMSPPQGAATSHPVPAQPTPSTLGHLHPPATPGSGPGAHPKTKQGKGPAAHPAPGHCGGAGGPRIPVPCSHPQRAGLLCTPAQAPGADGLPAGFTLLPRLPAAKQEAKAAPGRPRQPGHRTPAPPCPRGAGQRARLAALRAGRGCPRREGDARSQPQARPQTRPGAARGVPGHRHRKEPPGRQAGVWGTPCHRWRARGYLSAKRGGAGGE